MDSPKPPKKTARKTSTKSKSPKELATERKEPWVSILSLDVDIENLHQLFFKLRDEFGQTFVIVTHNEELANMADRKLVMVDGNIV